MQYLDLTLPAPEENLALDEALLLQCQADGGKEVLRVWESPEPFVVMGLADRSAAEVDLEECRARGIPVLRRASGGGTVVQGPGCLNFAVVLRVPETGPLRGIHGTNATVLGCNARALAELTEKDIRVQGISDLAVGDRKFSGNAQRRKRDWFVFHGTFLLDFDLPLIASLLRMPSRQPEYRRGRGHLQFLTNLNASAADVKSALRAALAAGEEKQDPPLDLTRDLAASQFSKAEWNFKF